MCVGMGKDKSTIVCVGLGLGLGLGGVSKEGGLLDSITVIMFVCV